MSKSIFSAILRDSIPDATPAMINGYWERAITANLPVRILEIIKLDLNRIPEVLNAYKAIYGDFLTVHSKDMASNLILEFLIEGPRYMREFHKYFGIPEALRRTIFEELIESKAIRFEFCPIGNCIIYELNPYKHAPKHIQHRIERVIGDNKVSIFHLWLHMQDIDYSYLCAWVRDTQRKNGSNFKLTYSANGRAHIERDKTIN